jgi:hypothetical protein
LARLLWEVVTKGEATLPALDKDGKPVKLIFGPDDWFDAVKFIYTHIDGPPPKAGDTEDYPQFVQLVEVVKSEIDE